jgi:hypothetical protein
VRGRARPERFEEGTGRFRALWRLIVQFIIRQVAGLLFVLLRVTLSTLNPNGPAASVLSESPFPSATVSLVAALFSVWLAVRFLDRGSFRSLGFRLDRGWIDLCFGLALGVLLMAAIFLFESAFGWVSVVGIELAIPIPIPIGLHITWNLFENAVYGFPVSGNESVASPLSTRQSEPEAGLLALAAELAGILVIALWVRPRTGEVSTHASIAEGYRRDRRKSPLR